MKYALIIGNDLYHDPKLAQLKTPAADVQALAKVLKDESIGAFDEVIPLVNKTESQVSRAISTFLTSKKPDDLVLVYFSGHGVLDDRGRLFLALKDTKTSLLKATAIPSSFIADEMDSCRSKRQILILDCCHSGAFERGIKGGEQKAVTETTFEGSGFGRVVLTASDSTQYALEGDQVISQTDLSLFTHFLLEGLQTGNADMNNDGHISLDEWYDFTYSQVLSTTPKQVPHKWSYHQQGDLIIATNPHVKKKVVELPVDLLRLLESPYSSIREVAVRELGALLHSRDSELAPLARAALEKLLEDDSRTVSLAAAKELSEVDKLGEDKPRLPLEPIQEQPPETQTNPAVQMNGSVPSSQAEVPVIVQKKKKEPGRTQPIKHGTEKKPPEKPVLEQAAAPPKIAIQSGKQPFRYLVPIIGIAGFLVITVILGLSGIFNHLIAPSSPPTAESSQPISTSADQPLETPTMTSADISVSLTAPTTLSDEITDAKDVAMRLVPAGNFIMGSSDADTNERPIHTVYLDDFYIDKYEVTNALYKACVTSGVCYEPQDTSNYDNPDYADHPVVYIDWNMASTYCEWRGAQLPTEAQWEKAARGTDGQTYPWGEDIDCSKANYLGCSGGTSNVMTHQGGISPYGVYDMAGSVWEWVADWFSETYYQDSPTDNPLGPDSGDSRVIRSGAWNQSTSNVRAAIRNWKVPPTVDNDIGFRCARNGTP